ncbi:Hypothetical protein, putative [Bodo saltans]|uniref:Uncharacterized protein n=1 Tax=Bodo saltans TaxID=75058 RepID=A0A0S4JDQ7_BODSA|nr:Hypothetical protein, putative [Bodo saltans]|eukprot:CUG88291.1 Hypothetical protein, putative [Bodo saltans]
MSHFSTSLSDARAEAEAARWYRHESSRSLQDRVSALEIAERLHAKRVQELAVREEVLHRTLLALPRGPVKDWERQVDDYIRKAVARVEPQPPIATFVKELEGRAVQLEYSLYQVRQRLTAVEKQERDVMSREARVAEREQEVTRARHAHETVWSELQNREALVVAHEEELHDLERELDAWSARLQRRQASLEEAPPRGGNGSTLPARSPPPAPQPPSSAPPPPLSLSSNTLDKDQRIQLVEVADYISRRYEALQRMEKWIQTRCQGIEEATARLHALHVRVGGNDPMTPGSDGDMSASPEPLSPPREDIHPFLQMFATREGPWR